MNPHSAAGLTAAIAYLESHLSSCPTWEAAAKAASYSPYHLHRSFTRAVGIPPHAYIRRRQLTEAARLLVFSPLPILDIALTLGYESQQAFSTAFKAFYKQTPLEYRNLRRFYPLQLPFSLSPPSPLSGQVTFADQEALAQWAPFLTLVLPGFPRLDRSAHFEHLRRLLSRRQVLVVKDGSAILAAASFSRRTGHIGFLAVRPQYRHFSLEERLLTALTCQLSPDQDLSITTFRSGDKADTGQRAAYLRLGFTEAELLTEFGYPAQRLILPADRKRSLYGI